MGASYETKSTRRSQSGDVDNRRTEYGVLGESGSNKQPNNLNKQPEVRPKVSAGIWYGFRTLQEPQDG